MSQPITKLLFDAPTVAARIKAIAGEIAAAAPSPLIVAIAEGALKFAGTLESDLRARGGKPELAVCRARRTVSGTELGRVELIEFPDADVLRGRDVVCVDDIADEGRTLALVLDEIRAAQPRSLHTAVLVSKLRRRVVDLKLDYIGFVVDDGWILGYGMDLDGDYRDLDYLAVLDEG